MLVSGCFSPGQITDTTADTDQATSTGEGSGSAPTTTTSTSTSGETDTTQTGGTGETSNDGTSSGGGPTSTTDDPSTGTTSVDGEESSSGEPVTCGDGGVCIPAIPEGWSGPVATRTVDIDDDIPPCGGDSYTDLQVSDALSGLAGADFECSCACDSDSLGCAGEATLQISDYPPPIPAGLSPCTDPSYVYEETIPSSAPQAVTIPMENLRGMILDDTAPGELVGGCQPEATEVATPAGFESRTVACGTFDARAEGCGDGLCVPLPTAPYDSPVCIWAEGDLECPAGFADRTVYSSDYTDNRGCSACTCGSPVGECTAQRIYIDAWCERDGFLCLGPDCGPEGTFACPAQARYNADALGFCETIELEEFCPLFPPSEVAECLSEYSLFELDELTYNAGLPDATCSPSGGTPVGAVEGTQPTTFCCAS